MSKGIAEKSQERPLRKLTSPARFFVTLLVSLGILAIVVNLQIQPGLDLLKENMTSVERAAAVDAILKGTAKGAFWAALAVFVGSVMQWNDGGKLAAVGRGLTAGAAGAVCAAALYAALAQGAWG